MNAEEKLNVKKTIERILINDGIVYNIDVVSTDSLHTMTSLNTLKLICPYDDGHENLIFNFRMYKNYDTDKIFDIMKQGTGKGIDKVNNFLEFLSQFGDKDPNSYKGEFKIFVKYSKIISEPGFFDNQKVIDEYDRIVGSGKDLCLYFYRKMDAELFYNYYKPSYCDQLKKYYQEAGFITDENNKNKFNMKKFIELKENNKNE